MESLVRNLAEHLDRWGGAPLMCVFDRPKTVALKWQKKRRCHRVESGLRLRHARAGRRGGVVLAS